MTHDPTRDCEHGRLKGKCDVCDHADELAIAYMSGLHRGKELAQPTPVAHPIIAGALFDFMGWLTSRKERLVLSSADNASPAVEAIKEFAKMRGLSLDGARVQDWQDLAPPAARPVKTYHDGKPWPVQPAPNMTHASDEWALTNQILRGDV